MKFLVRTLFFSILVGLLSTTSIVTAAPQGKAAAQLNDPSTRDIYRVDALREEVRHQLVMMPYYSVFDWLQADVKPDGSVALSGEVTRPTIKDDAVNRVKRLESVRNVTDNIEVLPLSPMDDQIRIAVYRAIFRFEGPLFRYSTQSVPPIHIIVKNGHVTLKGVTDCVEYRNSGP